MFTLRKLLLQTDPAMEMTLNHSVRIQKFLTSLICIGNLYLSNFNVASGQAIRDPRAKYCSGLQLNLSGDECIKVDVELNNAVPYSKSKAIQFKSASNEWDATPKELMPKFDTSAVKVHLDLTYFFLWNNDQAVQVLAFKYKPTKQELEAHKILRKFNLGQFLLPGFKEVQQKLFERQEDSVLQVYSSTDSIDDSFFKKLPICKEERIKSLSIFTLHQKNFPLVYKANNSTLPEYYAIIQATSYKLHQTNTQFIEKTFPVPLYIPDYQIQAAHYTHDNWMNSIEGNELIKNTVSSDRCFINYSFFPALNLLNLCKGQPEDAGYCKEVKDLFSFQKKSIQNCDYAFTVSNGITPAYQYWDDYRKTLITDGSIRHNYFIVPGKFFIPYSFKVNAVNGIPWAKYKTQICTK